MFSKIFNAVCSVIGAKSPEARAAVARAVRVIGGQVAAAVIVGCIGIVQSVPEASLVTVGLGAVLTAIDKFCRDKGVY